ncbi:MAG: hypothetical protein AAF654_13520 [Myxococcota bacterium]
MAHTFLIAACLLAPGGPFEDSRNGFRVELPDGWKHAKESSTPERTVFRKEMSGRRNRGVEGTLTVIQERLPSAIGLTGAYSQRLDAVRRKREFTMVEEAPERLLGVRARRLRYTVRNLDGTKVTTLEIIAYRAGRLFSLRFECPADKYEALIEPDLADFRSGFSAIEPKKPRPGGGSPLVGRWQAVSSPSSIIELSVDGSLKFGGAVGRYAISADTLTTLLDDGGYETYEWQLNNDTLVLLQPNRQPMKFKRAN